MKCRIRVGEEMTRELLAAIYTETTRNIRVSVVPAPLERDSCPERNVYAFSYTVTVENVGREVVQLLERHWIIQSADTQVGEIMGPGVVGAQPTLEPGQSFEYTSSAVIRDPIGSMHGTYTFRINGGDFFDVVIPRFDLVYPIMFH